MTKVGHYRKLEQMYVSALINNYYKPTIKISKGQSEIKLNIRPEFFHAAHAVHGSIYFKMLDDAAFFAVNSMIDDVFVLTVSFNIYFLRPVAKGEITAIGNIVSKSQRLFIAESILYNSENKEIARGSGTFMKSKIALSPELGYK